MALETGSFFVVIHERPWRSLTRQNTVDDTKKEVRVYDTVFIGYMFCTSFPQYHPLSLKRAWENLEEIVLKDNRTLLYQLYELEYQDRYRKK
jgi:hypothetical protein